MSVSTARKTRKAPPAISVPSSDRINEAVYAAVTKEGGRTAAAIADVTGLNRQAVAKALATLEAAGRITRTAGTGQARNAQPTWTATKINKSGTSKLRKGELATQAVGFLRERAGSDFTPGEIGRKLGNRSSGAVLNALTKLVPSGEVVQTSEKPVRFAVPASSNGSRPKKQPAASATRAKG
jgi:predicted ArsR family transcriptional regulator